MPDRDPANVETQYLQRFADFKGKDILEIGVGNGRLTWRYADKCKSVVAIDPVQAPLREAQLACPSRLHSKISFLHASAEQLPLPAQSFEGAILAWSL